MSLKVLIVDDDPIFVMMHKLRVKTSSIDNDPQTHWDGKTALDAINSDVENVHDYLLLLDINMPIMNGWELLNEIQKAPNANKVHVVMVSSSIDFRDKEKAMEYPQVIGFYEKALSADTCMEIKKNPAIAHYYN
jgi:CheY-like chemotaxis protein